MSRPTRSQEALGKRIAADPAACAALNAVAAILRNWRKSQAKGAIHD